MTTQTGKSTKKGRVIYNAPKKGGYRVVKDK